MEPSSLIMISSRVGIPSLSSSRSHASPNKSSSVSSWEALGVNWQLSSVSSTVSLSSSKSQALPSKSSSLFSWPGFGSKGQLSTSWSWLSLSSSASQTLPCRSLSEFNWFSFVVCYGEQRSYINGFPFMFHLQVVLVLTQSKVNSRIYAYVFFILKFITDWQKRSQWKSQSGKVILKML